MTNTFDLYVASLRRVAACQRRAAVRYQKAGELVSAKRALNIAVESSHKANRLEAASLAVSPIE